MKSVLRKLKKKSSYNSNIRSSQISDLIIRCATSKKHRCVIIADLFHRMAKVERIGSGIKRMRDFMQAAGLNEPHFEMTNFFRATFYRDPRYSLKSIQKGAQKSDQKILDIIAHNKFATRAELALQVDLSESGVKKTIKKITERRPFAPCRTR